MVLVCNVIVLGDRSYVTNLSAAQHQRAGIVLGSGVTPKGTPHRELQARLDVAAQAVNRGVVDKLLLSGDNRYLNYNEPEAMWRYLVTVRHISPSKLQVDYAGRSTYESCDRASRVFGIKSATIFSAQSHLSRAIYLCRHLGVEAYGVSSGVEANNSFRRELLARVKAVFNIYIYGEQTILGQKIKF